jgi:C-terminal processing protease CtpA/Prc
MKSIRRIMLALSVVMIVFGAAAAPAWATPPTARQSGPHIITGSYKTTNPIYPLLGIDPGAILYDLTGEVTRNFDFRLPLDGQVLGTLNGDIVSGDYQIKLPDTPHGIAHDFDGDPATPPAVQVFAAATYLNFLGDSYIDRGESALDLSVRLAPMTFNITGGDVIVWAADAGEQFPASLGSDGAAFTGDDPLLTLPAGWSVVSLDTDPFTVIRDDTVTVPIIESLGGLNDYSHMSFQDAWDTLFQRTRETYPFTSEKHLDWDAIYNDITPRVQAAQTLLDFHMAIIRLGAFIPDSHLNFVSMPVLQQYLIGGVGIGEIGITDDEQVVVVSVDPKSAAGRAGIQPGDDLISIDGVPALQAIDATPLLLSSASTPHARRRIQAGTVLQGPVGTTLDLTWRSPGGTEYSAQMVRVLDVSALFKALGGDALLSDVITSKMLDSGLGYIRITGFASEIGQVDALFASDLQALIDAGATGIILDVRDNGGGLVSLAMAMAGRFFPDYRRLMDFYYADGSGGFAYRGYSEILASEPYYDGPVAVLVNEMTASSGDLFAYAMQTDHRALIVGYTPTNGVTGEITDGQYKLPGDLQVQIPTGRTVDPETGAVLIEGTGVIPDIRVPRTWDSLMSPDDEVLQAAEAALLGQ